MCLRSGPHTPPSPPLKREGVPLALLGLKCLRNEQNPKIRSVPNPIPEGTNTSMPRTLPRRDAFPDGGAGGALQAQARTRTVRRRRLLAGNIGFSRRAEKKGTRRSPEHRSQGARKSEKMGCKEDSQPGPRPAPDVGARVPGRGGSRHAEASFSRLKRATRGGAAEKGSEQPPRTEVRDVLTAVQRGSGGVRGPASGEERTGSGRWGVQAGVPPGRAGSKEEGVRVH